MEFPRQEYWSGLPFPSPRDHPDPGIEPGSPALQADSLLSEPPGNFILQEILNKLKLKKMEQQKPITISISSGITSLKDNFNSKCALQ